MLGTQGLQSTALGVGGLLSCRCYGLAQQLHSLQRELKSQQVDTMGSQDHQELKLTTPLYHRSPTEGEDPSSPHSHSHRMLGTMQL